jgi:hypothetical protein
MEDSTNPQVDQNRNTSTGAEPNPGFGASTTFDNPYKAAMRGEIIIQQRLLNSGVSWFNTIAGCSLINSALTIVNVPVALVVGLGLSRLVTETARQTSGELGTTVIVIAVVLNLIAAGVFYMLGGFAKKRQTWAFVVGMVGYGADALLCLMVGLFLSAAFHAYAIYHLYKGFQACRELNQMEQSQVGGFFV